MYLLGNTPTYAVAAALYAIEILSGVQSYDSGKTVNRHSRFANDNLYTFPTGIFHNDKNKKERTQCQPFYLWTVGETLIVFKLHYVPFMNRTICNKHARIHAKDCNLISTIKLL